MIKRRKYNYNFQEREQNHHSSQRVNTINKIKHNKTLDIVWYPTTQRKTTSKSKQIKIIINIKVCKLNLLWREPFEINPLSKLDTL
jgi:hypothetical protein